MSRIFGNISQLGTAFFVEAAGGPLSVNATGRSGSRSAWFVGGQAGYEWSYGSHLLPALEIRRLAQLPPRLKPF